MTFPNFIDNKVDYKIKNGEKPRPDSVFVVIAVLLFNVAFNDKIVSDNNKTSR